jgi:hypothetical protein
MAKKWSERGRFNKRVRVEGKRGVVVDSPKPPPAGVIEPHNRALSGNGKMPATEMTQNLGPVESELDEAEPARSEADLEPVALEELGGGD